MREEVEVKLEKNGRHFSQSSSKKLALISFSSAHTSRHSARPGEEVVA
jgi:hypothetical protein